MGALRSTSPVATRTTSLAVGGRDAVGDPGQHDVQLLGAVDGAIAGDEPHVQTADETHCGCGLFVEDLRVGLTARMGTGQDLLAVQLREQLAVVPEYLGEVRVAIGLKKQLE